LEKGKGIEDGRRVKGWETCDVETEDERWEHLREKENGKF
jgi:hypothetical protein